MANLYIISGCNGAGKTTASFSVLPDALNCKEFVNADEIAKGLSPFQPDKVAIEAGRIMLNRIRDLMNQNVDFAFETTLATKSYTHFIKQAQAKGYFVTLVYFWLNTPELAIERVKARVLSGGHHIPTETIVRRYKAGIVNLVKLFVPLCNYWVMVDNSNSQFYIVAKGNGIANIEILDNVVYNKILNV